MPNTIYKPYGNLNKDYKLVWNDEFDGETLDLTKWTTEITKMVGRDVLIVEDTDKTTKVKDGNLILTAYKDEQGNYHVPNSVHTKSTMNFKYGYVEMRAKIPLDIGCFASFWTRSISDPTNPKSVVEQGPLDHFAEVDMFEVFQSKGKQCIGGNILKNSHLVDKRWYPTPMDWTQRVIIPDEEYHIYGYEWSPNEIKLYFDGMVYARFDISKPWTNTFTTNMGIPGWDIDITNYTDNTNTTMECFNEAQYLIFNHHLHIAVDDGNGGIKGFLASTSVTENVDFTSIDYIIDYCRLYQLDGQELYSV